MVLTAVLRGWSGTDRNGTGLFSKPAEVPLSYPMTGFVPEP